MSGYILLADGMRLDGRLAGAKKPAYGYLAANTGVVGFQEMITDPAYKGALLAFTYPEVGNVGVTNAFAESSGIQAAGIVVRVLSEFRTHYLSEDSLENALAQAGVPCLTGVDTRGLAVHLRDHGEVAAAIVPADTDPEKVRASLAALPRPDFAPTPPPTVRDAEAGTKIAVIDLGIRHSLLRQLAACSVPEVFAFDATAEAILAAQPAGVFVSDGPAAGLPPARTIETLKALIGRLPILACGLGHVALGAAMGCQATFLQRGHHGANCPVRNVTEGNVEVTEQRHSVALDRGSVEDNPDVELLWENMNDGSVEGIGSADETAIGLQFTLAASRPGAVNPHIQAFVNELLVR